MSDSPWHHIPGEATPIPPLDEDGLGGVLDDTAGLHSDINQIRDSIRNLALSPLTVEDTKNVLAALAGAEQNLVTAIGFLVERLTNPDTNPALEHLDAETAKQVQAYGEQYRYELAEFGPHQHAAQAIGLIAGI
ncbi:hypothetical protein [Streptomyces gardneri]|uniref:hypothetical protein n=1 Tax=Streptomyces gardneri TaxID=66892 RepID=UPI0035D9685E